MLFKSLNFIANFKCSMNSFIFLMILNHANEKSSNFLLPVASLSLNNGDNGLVNGEKSKSLAKSEPSFELKFWIETLRHGFIGRSTEKI